MKDLIAYVAIAIVAFLGGMLWAGRDVSPSSAEHAEALSALAAARDSLTRIPAIEVRWDTVIREGAPVLRLIRQPAERAVDTVIRTMPGAPPPPETVWVSGDEWVRWDFRDDNRAYLLTGTCNANLVNPFLSYTTFQLDVHERAVCPRSWRVELGGGLFAGRPFLGALIHYRRFRFGPLAGFEGAGSELTRLRYGAQIYYGVF